MRRWTVLFLAMTMILSGCTFRYAEAEEIEAAQEADSEIDSSETDYDVEERESSKTETAARTDIVKSQETKQKQRPAVKKPEKRIGEKATEATDHSSEASSESQTETTVAETEATAELTILPTAQPVAVMPEQTYPEPETVNEVAVPETEVVVPETKTPAVTEQKNEAPAETANSTTEAPVPETTVPETVPPVDTSAYASQVLLQINEERARNGLAALSEDPVLMQAAKVRADECAIQFDHNRPNGQPLDALITNGLWVYGETIHMGGGPEVCIQGWINSPMHHNILLSDGLYVGVGCSERADGVLFYAAIFAEN